MYEINKKVAFEDLMEKVMDLVTICGGWDEKAQAFKPEVEQQLEVIRKYAQEAIGEPDDAESPDTV